VIHSLLLSSFVFQGRKNPELAAKVALMRLKQSAKGLKEIPAEERVYFFVKPPDGTADVPVYFSKYWSVGRSVDAVAELLGLKNENNRSGAPQLRLFVASCAEEDVELPVASSWSALTAPGGGVVNGGSLELRYVTDTR
jgi:hypothetical protein